MKNYKFIPILEVHTYLTSKGQPLTKKQIQDQFKDCHLISHTTSENQLLEKISGEVILFSENKRHIGTSIIKIETHLTLKSTSKDIKEELQKLRKIFYKEVSKSVYKSISR